MSAKRKPQHLRYTGTGHEGRAANALPPTARVTRAEAERAANERDAAALARFFRRVLKGK